MSVVPSIAVKTGASRRQDLVRTLRTAPARHGCRRIAIDVLQPADLFVDLSGEDLRRRMFLIDDQAGERLCLRPDMTIPVCQAHLLALADGGPAAARLSYDGLVFRRQPEGSDRPLEAPQVGFELIGEDDTVAADCEALTITLDALKDAGIARYRLALGDLGIVFALIDGLDLPARWRRNLRLALWNPPRFQALVGRYSSAGGETAAGSADRQALVRVLGRLEPSEALAVVGGMLEIAGVGRALGRTPAEIAERFLDEAQDLAADPLPAEIANLIDTVLLASGPATPTVHSIAELALAGGVDLAAPVARFDSRAAKLADAGVDLGTTTFAARFGRTLEYYSGFVFEVYPDGAAASEPLAGGGRYDGLLEALGADRPIPAVGGALRVHAIEAALDTGHGSTPDGSEAS